SWYGDPRDLHSFPTRRSSDLGLAASSALSGVATKTVTGELAGSITLKASATASGGPITTATADKLTFAVVHGAPSKLIFSAQPRSEEHTSELQSRGHLVCRLL